MVDIAKICIIRGHRTLPDEGLGVVLEGIVNGRYILILCIITQGNTL